MVSLEHLPVIVTWRPCGVGSSSLVALAGGWVNDVICQLSCLGG